MKHHFPDCQGGPTCNCDEREREEIKGQKSQTVRIPTRQQREKWRKLAEDTRFISSVGEYTPEEFTTLLDAVDELERERDEARKFAETIRWMAYGRNSPVFPWEEAGDE